MTVAEIFNNLSVQGKSDLCLATQDVFNDIAIGYGFNQNQLESAWAFVQAQKKLQEIKNQPINNQNTTTTNSTQPQQVQYAQVSQHGGQMSQNTPNGVQIIYAKPYPNFEEGKTTNYAQSNPYQNQNQNQIPAAVPTNANGLPIQAGQQVPQTQSETTTIVLTLAHKIVMGFFGIAAFLVMIGWFVNSYATYSNSSCDYTYGLTEMYYDCSSYSGSLTYEDWCDYDDDYCDVEWRFVVVLCLGIVSFIFYILAIAFTGALSYKEELYLVAKTKGYIDKNIQIVIAIIILEFFAIIFNYVGNPIFDDDDYDNEGGTTIALYNVALTLTIVSAIYGKCKGVFEVGSA